MINPNPNAKFTDLTPRQLEIMWMSLEAARSLNLWAGDREDYNLLKTQVLQAWRDVKNQSKVNQN